MARGRLRVFIVLVVVLIIACLSAPSIQRLYHLFRLPFVWPNSSAQAIISEQRDHFDVTFSSFPANYSTKDAGLRPLIPARLHHIHLGPSSPRTEWVAARADCLKQHDSWRAFLWDDNNAPQFVEENYPHLYDMWKNYPFMVQRVDALRYMVLEKYGGAVLDFDLACKRSLEPLRQFNFVAPAAHPAGFSIGMMLASPNHPFIKSLVDSLPMFNHVWPLLSYVTIMFSTGCHYASTVYTLQENRSDLRILSGPHDNPNMHMLNGFVDTPLFRHLGSSSWHTKDARLILMLKDIEPKVILLIAVIATGMLLSLVWCCRLARRRLSSRQDVESDSRSPSPKPSHKHV
ncbi:uncharacterized protein PGRI_095280 [Penicillium griseofulvum]|uniref:Glycosyl transferase n=1 Tax=Penicillium patulum TaxID=5078 RepID=A0A135LQL9_PENPA|nr:uncharacterized protein PGRI_095280 [Penicillium griseofulvum]KXG51267.1 hypothetical protein PGRI_095280 [Penicillium griseofulvum]